MNRPNLFSFATSELSQDAFICWLLSWSSPENKNVDNKLHKCAISFINALFDKHDKIAPHEIKKVEVKKQYYNIDVVCFINDKYVLLIEDKIGTENHTNQLNRYFEEVKRNYMEEYILPTYYKTEDQGDYSEVLKARYKIFQRADILNLLNEYDGENTIIIDYREYLQSISNAVESYRNKPIVEWDDRYSWVGFYLRLQEEFDDCNWNYVPNKSGGFLGMWWHMHQENNSSYNHRALLEA